VVEDVGGPQEAIADGFPAELVASGAETGIDLAVLCVKGVFDWPLLRLHASGRKGTSFITAGFQSHNEKHLLIREIAGKLGQRIELELRGKTKQINVAPSKAQNDGK
jgi:hypothetical protein